MDYNSYGNSNFWNVGLNFTPGGSASTTTAVINVTGFKNFRLQPRRAAGFPSGTLDINWSIDGTTYYTLVSGITFQNAALNEYSCAGDFMRFVCHITGTISTQITFSVAGK